MKKKLAVLTLLVSLILLPAAETRAFCEDCFSVDLGNGNTVVDCFSLSTNNFGYAVCIPLQSLGTCVTVFLCVECFPIL